MKTCQNLSDEKRGDKTMKWRLNAAVSFYVSGARDRFVQVAEQTNSVVIK